MSKHARALVSFAAGALLLVANSTAGVTAANASAPASYPSLVSLQAASGQPTMQLSAASGYQGSSFTVSGSGYPSGEQLNVFMGPNSGSAMGNYLDTAQVAVDGTFSVLVSIPSGTAPGQQDITLRDMGSQPLQSLPFTVLPPVISVSAASGTRGSDVTVSGVGFGTGENLTIFLGGMELGQGQVSGAGKGTFSFQVSVPYMILAGPQTLEVSSDQGGTWQFPFEVLAPPLALSLSPASGVPGTDFNVNIAGYVPGENIQVFFGSGQQYVQQFTVYTDASTYFPGFVPNGVAPGQYTVTVVGSRTTTPQTAQYTVLGAPQYPQIGLSAAQGGAGTGFIIAGSGYTPGVTVTAAFGPSGPQLGSATADSNGDFRINATVPTASAGAQTIVVTAPGTAAVSTPFTVLAAIAPVTTAPVTSVTEPLPPAAAVDSPASAQIPASNSTDRGLRIQTSIQETASAPVAGSVLPTSLLGALGLGLLFVVALLRRRRA